MARGYKLRGEQASGIFSGCPKKFAVLSHFTAGLKPAKEESRNEADGNGEKKMKMANLEF